tara:strand:+ start:443 stop:1099 length:657 start_codon:yes stop_codon:yes gene_type:complete
MNELNQLLLNFGSNKNFDKNDYFVSSSNYFAYNLINNWPKWEKKIINLFGDKYSGKTHLSTIFKTKCKGKFLKSEELNNLNFKDLKVYECIIVDGYNNDVEENLLYSIFNLIEQDNKYLLINSRRPINAINFRSKDMLSRAKNCLFAELKPPDDELIFAIILKSFSDRQIKLDKKLLDFIIKRINRSYSNIHEFIYKIDELSLKKKQSINLKIIREII